MEKYTKKGRKKNLVEGKWWSDDAGNRTQILSVNTGSALAYRFPEDKSRENILKSDFLISNKLRNLLHARTQLLSLSIVEIFFATQFLLLKITKNFHGTHDMRQKEVRLGDDTANWLWKVPKKIKGIRADIIPCSRLILVQVREDITVKKKRGSRKIVQKVVDLLNDCALDRRYFIALILKNNTPKRRIHRQGFLWFRRQPSIDAHQCHPPFHFDQHFQPKSLLSLPLDALMDHLWGSITDDVYIPNTIILAGYGLYSGSQCTVLWLIWAKHRLQIKVFIETRRMCFTAEFTVACVFCLYFFFTYFYCEFDSMARNRCASGDLILPPLCAYVRFTCRCHRCRWNRKGTEIISKHIIIISMMMHDWIFIYVITRTKNNKKKAENVLRVRYNVENWKIFNNGKST